MGTTVKPYNKENTSKKEEVAEMFDNISVKYDFLNHFLSLGIDKIWRKKAVKILGKVKPKVILDMATGTGDFAIESLKLNPTKIVGVDLSNGMLEVGRKKMIKKNIDHIIEMHQGDSENLNFETNTFDGFTVGFGVRNFQDLSKGLSELLRVLRPGGIGVILEFSKPTNPLLDKIYDAYSFKLLPKIGELVAKDGDSYQYLAESIRMHPDQSTLKGMMEEAGFERCQVNNLTGGIVAVHTGYKL